MSIPHSKVCCADPRGVLIIRPGEAGIGSLEQILAGLGDVSGFAWQAPNWAGPDQELPCKHATDGLALIGPSVRYQCKFSAL